MNAYEMLLQLRYNVGETTDGTTSRWRNIELLRNLNLAQNKVYQQLSLIDETWFMKKSSAITPSSSSISLPSDCGKPAYLEEASSGRNLPIRGTVRERRLTRIPGTTIFSGVVDVYALANTLEVNQDSFTDQVYLWYIQKPVDLHTGTAAAGAATSLTLEASLGHSVINDYYNGQTIVVVSGTGVGSDTISDYVGSTRVCTVTGTYSTDSVYGTVSILPEQAHGLILLEATALSFMKPGTSVDPTVIQNVRGALADEREHVENWFSERVAASHHVRITELD